MRKTTTLVMILFVSTAIAGCVNSSVGREIAPWLDPLEPSATSSPHVHWATNTPPSMLVAMEPTFTPPASRTPEAVPPSHATDGHTHDLDEGQSNPEAAATPRPSAQAGSTDEILPDLQNLPPFDLKLIYDPDSKRTFVRFSNPIHNAGPGTLELIGRPTADREHIVVSQRILNAEGQVVRESMVGEYIFHEQHNHWHLAGFSVYEVWSVSESGDLIAPLASSGKVSYCVSDTSYRTDDPDNTTPTPRPTYTTCYDELQGLSVGWVDVYYMLYPGQYVEITELSDGVYALVATVNPENTVLETNDANNAGATYFELKDLRLTVLEDYGPNAPTKP
jgi:hypothetical protein